MAPVSTPYYQLPMFMSGEDMKGYVNKAEGSNQRIDNMWKTKEEHALGKQYVYGPKDDGPQSKMVETKAFPTEKRNPNYYSKDETIPMPVTTVRHEENGDKTLTNNLDEVAAAAGIERRSYGRDQVYFPVQHEDKSTLNPPRLLSSFPRRHSPVVTQSQQFKGYTDGQLPFDESAPTLPFDKEYLDTPLPGI